MMIRDVITALFLIAGFLLFTVSTIGVIRLPDFFTRLHASGIGETLGMFCMGIGLVIYEGLNFTSLKILLIVISVFLVNPVGTHLIGKSAIMSGHKPWKESENADISD